MTGKYKVMTLHTIARTKTPGKHATANSPAIPPVTENVPPYSIITVSKQELDDYEPMGAVTTEIDGRAQKDYTADEEDAEDAQKEAQRRAVEASRAFAAEAERQRLEAQARAEKEQREREEAEEREEAARKERAEAEEAARKAAEERAEAERKAAQDRAEAERKAAETAAAKTTGNKPKGGKPKDEDLV